MSLYLIRHGEAESNINIERGFVGSDRPLTKEGVRQSKEVAEYFKQLGRTGLRYHHTVYSSPYLRTLQTSEIIAIKLDLVVAKDKRLQEIQKTNWHARPVPEIMEVEASIPESLRPFHRFHGGENWDDVARRMQSFMREQVKLTMGKTSLIVSHNHPIQMAVGSLRGLPVAEWEDRTVDTGSISRINHHDGELEVDEACFNYRPQHSSTES